MGGSLRLFNLIPIAGSAIINLQYHYKSIIDIDSYQARHGGPVVIEEWIMRMCDGVDKDHNFHRRESRRVGVYRYG